MQAKDGAEERRGNSSFCVAVRAGPTLVRADAGTSYGWISSGDLVISYPMKAHEGF